MWRVTLLTALAVLAGCQSIQTTRALSSLQTEYGDLVHTEAGCEKDKEGGDKCLADFRVMYGSIEAQADAAIAARGAAQTPTEQQITIGLHRLAAFAALKSKSGKAATYGDRGQTLCDAVPVKPPRDCALLQVVGHYEVVNEYAADVECLIAGSGKCPRSFEQAASDFCRVVYKPLVAATDKARATPFLSESVKAYMDAQPTLARESQQAFAKKLMEGLGFDAQPRQPCECIRLAASDPRFGELCGQVANQPRATFKAECVRRALEKGEDCPSL